MSSTQERVFTVKMDYAMTKEPQYQPLLEAPEVKLGVMSGHTWINDPKRLVFMLSRYKFVAKMLRGSRNVIEIGCGDGFGSRIVRQQVDQLTAIDFDDEFISRAVSYEPFTVGFDLHDILKSKYHLRFESAYALDVIEHIPVESERVFLQNICDSLSEEGVLLIGTPSLNSQTYASEQSRRGHVNCKGSESLKLLLLSYFENVFMFSMNDEVIHTGFSEMAHYLFALCTNKRI